MANALLIGNNEVSWRDWLKENRAGRDFLCLDPCDAVQGLSGRICLFRGGRPLFQRFYGSLEPSRFPQILLAAAAEATRLAEGDLLVQCFTYQPSPLLRHLVALLAQIVKPDAIFVAKGTLISLEGFPVGPLTVELERGFPSVVRDAQRKAHWMKLLESATHHHVSLDSVAIEGGRLGSGERVSDLRVIGLGEAVHAEVCGTSLFVVTDAPAEEGAIARAMDITHTSRTVFAAKNDYNNLVCSFARQSGEDFGFGMVQSIDWVSRTMHVLNDAIPPAPVQIVKLGSLRVDPKGRELGETRPWQV